MECKRDSDDRQFDHVSLQTMRLQAVAAVKRAVFLYVALGVGDSRGIRRLLRAAAARPSRSSRAPRHRRPRHP